MSTFCNWLYFSVLFSSGILISLAEDVGNEGYSPSDSELSRSSSKACHVCASEAEEKEKN